MNIKNYMVGEDAATLQQIEEIIHTPAYLGQKVRIMPDAHAGAGVCVGFTSTYTDKIVPSTVGVDIACRVSLYQIPDEIDLEKLDRAIHDYIPAGFAIHETPQADFDLTVLRCYNGLSNIERIEKSLGTLGGGNHYIAVDKGHNATYLCIHTGSRNLGVQVAKYYQQKAMNTADKYRHAIWVTYERLEKETKELAAEQNIKGKRLGELIQGLHLRREEEIARLIPAKGLEYIEGEDLANYLHDMRVLNEWSAFNHDMIYSLIAQQMDWSYIDHITCIHNYVDVDNNMIRKGAISAQKGETCIIPLNMRDGIILGVGKGNEDWNCSAPHGAGRIMSRKEAKESIDLQEFQETMSKVYSTCIGVSTLDEAPMAYKNATAIIEAILPTVKIIDHLQEIYNFKATD